MNFANIFGVDFVQHVIYDECMFWITVVILLWISLL